MEEVFNETLFCMAWAESRHTCFEKRSKKALFHASFFCFTGNTPMHRAQK
jgi:hypothetical protein